MTHEWLSDVRQARLTQTVGMSAGYPALLWDDEVDLGSSNSCTSSFARLILAYLPGKIMQFAYLNLRL